MASPEKRNYNELIYIGIGTNLGDRMKHIKLAAAELESLGIRILRTSSIYETKAWGFESDDLFLNAVFECTTTMTATDCLKTTQFVEKKMGRTKTAVEGYESRIIDLDILLFKDEKTQLPGLTIPHPYITERQFVITPMYELTDSFFFHSLGTDFDKLKNKFETGGIPFVVYKPPLVNE